jgi:hypothetical protein
MLAVLCSSPRPPLGVAIIGLTIAMLSWVLHLLPYIMFCGMVTLSIWPPSHPPPLEVIYHPVDGLPNHVHVVYTRVGYQESHSIRTKRRTPVPRFPALNPGHICSRNRPLLSRPSVFPPDNRMLVRNALRAPCSTDGLLAGHLDPHPQCASLVRVRRRFHR